MLGMLYFSATACNFSRDLPERAGWNADDDRLDPLWGRRNARWYGVLKGGDETFIFKVGEAEASEGAVMTPGTCMNVRIVKKNWILPICFRLNFALMYQGTCAILYRIMSKEGGYYNETH